MHLTGDYPPWWTGRRFSRPITMLTGSESYELTRDGVQRLLLGPPADKDKWGTGAIPHAAIVGTDARQGVPNAVENVMVKHVSGGNSTCQFKAYEQGRSKWQASTVDYVWCDEEPPEPVYIEGLTRTNATGGCVVITCTPLLGMSTVIARYLLEASKDRHVTTMTIDDAPHISPAMRAQIIASYPAHEREARTMGVPSMGSGRIFPIVEASIVCEPFPIPRHWPEVGGVDFGWDHPFGAVKCAWDRDNDVWHVTADYREREATPIIHAAALRPWGPNMLFAWPHDGLQHDKGSGDQLAELYRKQGLAMCPERATFDDGTNGVEAGILDMLERMQTGRWKVFSTCRHWLEEFRTYHRKDGKIVKERDDVLSASRYALMMKRFAEVQRKVDVTAYRPQYRAAGAWMG